MWIENIVQSNIRQLVLLGKSKQLYANSSVRHNIIGSYVICTAQNEIVINGTYIKYCLILETNYIDDIAVLSKVKTLYQT